MKTVTNEKPILFSGPMVRAILDDRKTQTRRIVKPQPKQGAPYGIGQLPGDWTWPHRDGLGATISNKVGAPTDWVAENCRYPVGTRLWVREALRRERYEGQITHGYQHPPEDSEWTYAADGRVVVMRHDRIEALAFFDTKRNVIPSIHMPRWASRITLEVTGVRVERVQDISESDAKAEGVYAWFETVRTERVSDVMPNSKTLFRNLWSNINGPDSWNTNPWVWVYTFRRVAP